MSSFITPERKRLSRREMRDLAFKFLATLFFIASTTLGQSFLSSLDPSGERTETGGHLQED